MAAAPPASPRGDVMVDDSAATAAASPRDEAEQGGRGPKQQERVKRSEDPRVAARRAQPMRAPVVQSTSMPLNMKARMILLTNQLSGLNSLADKVLTSSTDLSSLVSRQTLINNDLIKQYRDLYVAKQELEARMQSGDGDASALQRQIDVLKLKLEAINDRIAANNRRLEADQNAVRDASNGDPMFPSLSPDAQVDIRRVSTAAAHYNWYTRATLRLSSDIIENQFVTADTGAPYNIVPTFNDFDVTVDSPAFCPVVSLTADQLVPVSHLFAVPIEFSVLYNNPASLFSLPTDKTLIPYTVAYMAGVILATDLIARPYAAVFLDNYEDRSGSDVQSFDFAFFDNAALRDEFIYMKNTGTLNPVLLLALRYNTPYAATFAAHSANLTQALGAYSQCCIVSMRFPWSTIAWSNTGRLADNRLDPAIALLNSRPQQTPIPAFGVLAVDGDQKLRQFWVTFDAHGAGDATQVSHTVGDGESRFYPVFRRKRQDQQIEPVLLPSNLNLLAVAGFPLTAQLHVAADNRWRVPVESPASCRPLYSVIITEMSVKATLIWVSDAIKKAIGIADVIRGPRSAGSFGMQWSAGASKGNGPGRVVRPRTLLRYMLAVRKKYFPLNQSRVFLLSDPDYIPWTLGDHTLGDYGLVYTPGFSMQKLRNSAVLYTGDNLPLSNPVNLAWYDRFGYAGYCSDLADELSTLFDTEREVSDILTHTLNEQSAKLHAALARARTAAAATGL